MSTEAIFTLPEAPAVAPAAPAPEGVYAHDSTMVADAQARLIDFFNKPRWRAFLAVLIGEVQELEDANWLTHTSFDFETAVGDQLDIIGKLIGERRNDRTDANYRVAIAVRVLVNSSDGKLEQLISIISTADSTLTSEAREVYPAGIMFRWLGTFPTLTAPDLVRLLKQAKAGGVKLQAVVRNPTTGFRWGTVAAAGTAATLCFSKVDKTGGGVLEEVY